LKELPVPAVGFKEKKKGEVTIFLSLVFLVLISLVGALMESISIRLSKNENRMNLEMAMESVFAEYDKELLNNYEIFALDGTYGVGEYEEKLLLERMKFYGAAGTENSICAVEFLSDNKGEPFYRQAVRYMRNKYGLPEHIDEEGSAWIEKEKEATFHQDEEKAVQETLMDKLEEEGVMLPSEDNPITAVEDVKRKGLVKVVLPEDKTVSNLCVRTDELATGRELRKGNYLENSDENLISDTLFREYLLQQFYNYFEEQTARSLAYEIEYILCGRETDAKNLEKVLQRILLLRLVPNYTCLLADPERKGEVSALASNLCLLLQSPGVTLVVEQAIFFAWAYGESVAELQILMDGGKVSAIKKKEEWILPLQKLSNIANIRYKKEKGVENGMDYKQYLRIFLLLTKRDQLCMRAIDLMECDSKTKADSFITRMQVTGTCSLRRHLTYEFYAQYAYR